MRREDARGLGDARPPTRVVRAAAAALALVTLATAARAAAEPCELAPARYRVDATLDPDARVVSGTVDVAVENAARAALDEIVLVLYPNRFARPEPGIDDLNRPYVYPREELVPGGIAVERLEARRAGEPARTLADVRLVAIDGWPETALRAGLPAPLAPGDATTLRVTFRTVLPERYGPFGVADGAVVALGGWYPLLAARDADGGWRLAPEARPAPVEGVLRVPARQTVVADARVVAGARASDGGAAAETDHGAAAADAAQAAQAADTDRGGEAVVALRADESGGPALLAARDYRVHETTVDGGRVVFLELPVRRARMFPPWRRAHAAVVLDAVERIVRTRPAGLALPAEALVVAEARLRLELIAPSRRGLAVVSDRILRTDPILRGFHERALAAAVYGALLRPVVAARERAEDVPWITEGMAAAVADRYLARERPGHRTVYDWIRLFNVFAIVDRFETAPKIPFAHTFFPEARHADELRDGVESFARDRPAGGTILTKLRNEVGDAPFAEIVDAYVAGRAPLRAVAAERAGRSLDWLFEQWTAPYPEPLNYALRAVRLNERVAAPAPAYRHRIVVERDAARPVRERVDVEVVGRGDERAHLVWNDDAARAEFELTTPWRARRVTLDPERRLLEDTRVDDVRPAPFQLVLDSADVTVTSSEFGISGLFVARRRYDYRKDLGAVVFYSDRGLGFTFGPRLHFGPANDPTSYRHNLYGFYTLADLDGSFHDDSRPSIRTDGDLGGFGLRYDYTDEFVYDNPTRATKVRLFADVYDRAFGSSFDYVDWGVRASVVRPLLTARTLVAAQVLNAFSTPIGGDRVPNQGRYSLGGDLAVRAIPIEERLGENLALARVELRQTLYPELDLSLADVVVLRRGQLRLFVDAGHVEDRRESLYRLGDFAVGVGVGFAAFYDFLGFHPAVAYVAIAQRVDRPSESGVQFLFGTRQAF